jgi:hypothetical protein
MATTPQFSSTVRTAFAQVTTANTNRDGTGTIATIFTAGSSGSRIENVTIQAAVTTTAGMVRLYIHDGTNARLFFEQAITAATPSATVKAFAATIAFGDVMPLLLANGYSLRASTEKTETFNIIVFGGDF